MWHASPALHTPCSHRATLFALGAAPEGAGEKARGAVTHGPPLQTQPFGCSERTQLGETEKGRHGTPGTGPPWDQDRAGYQGAAAPLPSPTSAPITLHRNADLSCLGASQSPPSLPPDPLSGYQVRDCPNSSTVPQVAVPGAGAGRQTGRALKRGRAVGPGVSVATPIAHFLCSLWVSREESASSRQGLCLGCCCLPSPRTALGSADRQSSV